MEREWLYTGRIFKMEDFDILDLEITPNPMFARPTEVRLKIGGQWVKIVPYGEDFAEVEMSEEEK